LEDWGVLNSADSGEEAPDAAGEEGAESTGEASTTGEAEAEADTEVVEEGLTVPTCDTLYSADLTTQLLEELRSNFGDTSEGNVGYGTTNQDLVPLLTGVRNDLRISCTWYLPASESVSVTSVAIVSGDVLDRRRRCSSGCGCWKR
jgi:hypothetical protein